MDHVGQVGAHELEAIQPELGERVAADDGIDALAEIAGQREVVLVGIDFGIRAPVDAHVRAEEPRGDLHDFRGIAQGLRRPGQAVQKRDLRVQIRGGARRRVRLGGRGGF